MHLSTTASEQSFKQLSGNASYVIHIATHGFYWTDSEVRESGIHGSCITVSNFIKMIENHQNGTRKYSHKDLREIFGMDRQILLKDVYESGNKAVYYSAPVVNGMVAESRNYGKKD